MNTTEPRIYLTGNTYPFREQIKAAGGRWDKERKAWHVPAEARDAMRRLAAQARLHKRQASSREPSEDQRIVAHGTLVKDKSPIWIAWMGRIKATGHLMARIITQDGRRAAWAAGKDVRVERRFDTPLPLCGLLTQMQEAQHA